MFYHNRRGERIQIANKRPINFSKGGLVPVLPNIPKKHLDEDTVLSELEVGSLVVPVPVMKMGVMKQYKGETTGPKQTDKEHLVRAIIMPNEMVVHKKHASKVESFLRKKGITLPFGR